MAEIEPGHQLAVSVDVLALVSQLPPTVLALGKRKMDEVNRARNGEHDPTGRRLVEVLVGSVAWQVSNVLLSRFHSHCELPEDPTKIEVSPAETNLIDPKDPDEIFYFNGGKYDQLFDKVSGQRPFEQLANSFIAAMVSLIEHVAEPNEPVHGTGLRNAHSEVARTKMHEFIVTVAVERLERCMAKTGREWHALPRFERRDHRHPPSKNEIALTVSEIARTLGGEEFAARFGEPPWENPKDPRDFRLKNRTCCERRRLMESDGVPFEACEKCPVARRQTAKLDSPSMERVRSLPTVSVSNSERREAS